MRNEISEVSVIKTNEQEIHMQYISELILLDIVSRMIFVRGFCFFQFIESRR